MNKISFGLVLGVLVMGGCSFSPSQMRQDVQQQIVPAEELPPITLTPATDAIYKEIVVSSTPAIAFKVIWQKPQKVDASVLGEAFVEAGYKETETNTNANRFYKVGSTQYNGKPAEVYMGAIWPEGPAWSPDYSFFVKQGSKVEFIEKLIGYTDTSVKKGGSIPDLHRKSFVGATPRQVFEYQWSIGPEVAPPLVPVLSLPSVGQVYTATSTQAYYIAMGPLYGIYALKIDFYDKDNLVPNITWSDGTKNTSEYNYRTIGGCGSSNYLAIVDGINKERDLVVVGKNNKGDDIYALKNSDDQRLKDMYESTYFPGEKLSYDAFIAQRPLLYWVSPLGDMVQLQNFKFGIQAECGKPVIYLYPLKTTTTTVILQPQGGFTYSEPEYVVDWYVKAEPNGHLTDIRTNKEYQYLYWEGRGGYYVQPKQGWVIQKSKVASFLKEKLRLLGLNKSETVDFMEFWLPRMQEKPYYFITFMGNSTMDMLAPLTVTPKPDTVIRILMDFTPLDKPISAKGYAIKTPKRKGFTVVEWGGVIR